MNIINNTLFFCSFTLAKVIDSIQNDHLILPGEKMNFIIAICDSEIELLNPQGSKHYDKNCSLSIPMCHIHIPILTFSCFKP